MNSRDYWERRAAQDMYDRMGTAEDTAAEMNAAIRQTSAYLEKEVKAVMRGMQSFGISEAEAKKILNAAGDGTALQRLRKAAQQVGDPEKREALVNAINSAGAYRYRITRIEELNRDINRQCRELYKTENRHITSALRSVAEDSYYHEIFSIQKGTGLGFSFSKFPRQDVDRILRSNWSGSNYSQRIWKDVSGMTARLKNELLVSMLSGRSGEKTARIFQEQFGVNAYCARRLVRTESAYVANAAQSRAYDEAGIERYRFVATLDSRTCECCAALDGKVFELANAKPGTNYPPMHPFCRSTTIADFGDEELAGLERRAKDKDGNTVKVPADMSYEEWHRKFVEGEPGRTYGSEKPSEKHYLKGDYNIKFNKISGTKEITENLAKEFSDQHDKAARLFGLEKLDKMKAVDIDTYRNDGIYGHFAPNSGVVTIYGAGGKDGKAFMAKVAKEMKKKGSWSTDSPLHAYRHELGHAIQEQLSASDSGYVEKLKMITDFRQSILDDLTKLPESDIIKEKAKILSVYGIDDTDKIDEFISECIAEYLNGKPRPTAKKIVDILLGRS